MTYHKTKDILYVKKLLGHRDLRSTLKYIQLIDFGTDEYHVAVAKTVQEAIQLAEQGFVKFDEIDGIHLYRKRK